MADYCSISFCVPCLRFSPFCHHCGCVRKIPKEKQNTLGKLFTCSHLCERASVRVLQLINNRPAKNVKADLLAHHRHLFTGFTCTQSIAAPSQQHRRESQFTTEHKSYQLRTSMKNRSFHVLVAQPTADSARL